MYRLHVFSDEILNVYHTVTVCTRANIVLVQAKTTYAVKTTSSSAFRGILTSRSSDLPWEILPAFVKPHTANALYRKFETNISRNESARPRSQFLHSKCVCDQFIYVHDLSANAIQIVGMYKSLTDT
jgi:hypothetical protein